MGNPAERLGHSAHISGLQPVVQRADVEERIEDIFRDVFGEVFAEGPGNFNPYNRPPSKPEKLLMAFEKAEAEVRVTKATPTRIPPPSAHHLELLANEQFLAPKTVLDFEAVRAIVDSVHLSQAEALDTQDPLIRISTATLDEVIEVVCADDLVKEQGIFKQ